MWSGQSRIGPVVIWRADKSQAPLTWLSLTKRCVMLGSGSKPPWPSVLMNLGFNKLCRISTALRQMSLSKAKSITNVDSCKNITKCGYFSQFPITFNLSKGGCTLYLKRYLRHSPNLQPYYPECACSQKLNNLDKKHNSRITYCASVFAKYSAENGKEDTYDSCLHGLDNMDWGTMRWAIEQTLG